MFTGIYRSYLCRYPINGHYRPFREKFYLMCYTEQSDESVRVIVVRSV